MAKKRKETMIDIAAAVAAERMLDIPAGTVAQAILAKLGLLNDEAMEAQKRYLDLKERTKTAKETYDNLAEQVLTELRQATHGGDLPLFDEKAREADQIRMETGPEALTEASGAAPGADLGSDEPEMDPEDSRRADAF